MFGIYIYREHSKGTESVYKACVSSMEKVNDVVKAFEDNKGSEKGYTLRVVADGREIIRK